MSDIDTDKKLQNKQNFDMVCMYICNCRIIS